MKRKNDAVELCQDTDNSRNARTIFHFLLDNNANFLLQTDIYGMTVISEVLNCDNLRIDEKIASCKILFELGGPLISLIYLGRLGYCK